MDNFIIIDGTGLVYRGFYAIPPYLKSKNDILTNAVFGFSSIILTILAQYKPTHMAIAFDLKGPTARHIEFKDYKATRKKAPDELYAQIPLAKHIIDVFNIPKFELSGYEADDLIGTIVNKVHSEKNLQIYIATGDKDLFQLVNSNVRILYPANGFRAAVILDDEKIKEKYGITPSQICDYKGLVGDTSDNIPGVTGIGPKGASSLVSNYGSLENIYEHLNEIPDKLREKLISFKDNAFLSKKLCCLDLFAPINFDLSICRVNNFNAMAVIKVFEEYGFKSLIPRLNELYPQSKLVLIDDPVQIPMF